jgi:hypothetical protein
MNLSDELGIRERLEAAESECLRLQADLGHGRDERAKLRQRLVAAEALLREVLACDKTPNMQYLVSMYGDDWLKRAKEVCGE